MKVKDSKIEMLSKKWDKEIFSIISETLKSKKGKTKRSKEFLS